MPLKLTWIWRFPFIQTNWNKVAKLIMILLVIKLIPIKLVETLFSIRQFNMALMEIINFKVMIDLQLTTEELKHEETVRSMLILQNLQINILLIRTLLLISIIRSPNQLKEKTAILLRLQGLQQAQQEQLATTTSCWPQVVPLVSWKKSGWK